MRPAEVIVYDGAQVGAVLPRYFEELVTTYLELYNARGRHEWQEDWTRETAGRKVLDALSLDQENRHPVLGLMLDQETREVAGFLLGAVLKTPENLGPADFPDATREQLEPSDVARVVSQLARDSRFPLLSLPEFGIRRPYRGGIRPIAGLIIPTIRRGRELGCRETLAWSTEGKKSLVLFKLFHGGVYPLGGPRKWVCVKNNILATILLTRVALASGRLFFPIMLRLKKVEGIRESGTGGE